MTDIPRHADLPDLAYPYALDALSPADRRAVEHALDRADEPTATEFRATVRAVRDTLAAMTAADSVPAHRISRRPCSPRCPRRRNRHAPSGSPVACSPPRRRC